MIVGSASGYDKKQHFQSEFLSTSQTQTSMTFRGENNYALIIQASHENSSEQLQQINGKSTFSSNHIFRLALIVSVT